MKHLQRSHYPGSLRKKRSNTRNNLLKLAAEMGISNLEIARAPEQISILNALKARRPEKLSTRALADLCGISIYKVRHLLLPLEKCDRVRRDRMHKHHQWFLSQEPTEF